MSDNNENGTAGSAPDRAATENLSADAVAPTASAPSAPAASPQPAPVPPAAAPMQPTGLPVPPASAQAPIRTAAPRWLVIVVAIIAGVLLLGIGFGAGLAVGGHRGAPGIQNGQGWQGPSDRGQGDHRDLPGGRGGSGERGERGGSDQMAPTPTPGSTDGPSDGS